MGAIGIFLIMGHAENLSSTVVVALRDSFWCLLCPRPLCLFSFETRGCPKQLRHRRMAQIVTNTLLGFPIMTMV